METLEFVVLDIEDREQVDCLILGVFDFEGKQYIAVSPEDTEDELYLFEYIPYETREDGVEEYDVAEIEDEEEYGRALEYFLDMAGWGDEEEEEELTDETDGADARDEA